MFWSQPNPWASMTTGPSGGPVTTTLFLLTTPASAIALFSYSPGSAGQPDPAVPGAWSQGAARLRHLEPLVAPGNLIAFGS